MQPFSVVLLTTFEKNKFAVQFCSTPIIKYILRKCIEETSNHQPIFDLFLKAGNVMEFDDIYNILIPEMKNIGIEFIISKNDINFSITINQKWIAKK